MKKLIASAIFVLVLSIALVGCGKKNQPAGPRTSGSNTNKFPSANMNKNTNTNTNTGIIVDDGKLDVDKDKLDKLKSDIEGMDFEDLNKLSE